MMKDLTAFIIYLLFGCSTFAQGEDKPWLGKWKITRLICPFGCPYWKNLQFQGSQSLYNKIKNRQIEYSETTAVSLEFSCIGSSVIDWSRVKKTTAGAYLKEWSNNESANKKPKIKSKLPTILGLKRDTSILAGIVGCSSGGSMNLIFVNSNKVFLFDEENAYFELAR